MTDPVWRERTLRGLYRDRHELLHHKWAGTETPAILRVRRMIEHEIDFYEMQEAKPGRDAMRARLRELTRLTRRIHAKLDREHGDPIGTSYRRTVEQVARERAS